MFTVYVVDDDSVILDNIMNDVPWMDNGFKVVGFQKSAKLALKEIPVLSPDVVFTDLKMPEMDGVDLIIQLIELGVSCEYVMLSAFGSFEDSRRFFLQNGFDYILKPLQNQDMQILMERLAQRLAKKRQTLHPSEKNSVFEEMIAYLNENYNQKHSLEGLGKRFSLNSNYICSLFSKHMNSTLTRYITSLRMKEALNKMQTTKKAYKEIAIDCGYSDYFYFCKVFKEYYGSSPTEYLNNIKSGISADSE